MRLCGVTSRGMLAGAEARFLPLDGLRAAAIIAVFAHHALHVPLLWAGVDMFFVLSGYLITNILIRTRDRPDYFRRFYRNRTYRIFPIYYVVVALCLVAFGAEVWRQAPWALTYTMNFERGLHANDTPMTPLWSLAVEEQFYLLWPLALWVCPAARRLRLIAALIVVAPLCRAVTYWWLGSVAAGTFLFNRMDGLLFGALLAVLLSNPEMRERVRRIALLTVVPLGLALAGIAYFAAQDGPVFAVGVYEASAMFFAATLAIIVTGGALGSNRLLALAPIVALGRISYGLYLIHMPAIFLARRFVDSDLMVAALAGAATLVLAALSWKFFELPLLRLRDRRQSQRRPETELAVSR